jgi:hypothetical protein
MSEPLHNCRHVFTAWMAPRPPHRPRRYTKKCRGIRFGSWVVHPVIIDGSDNPRASDEGWCVSHCGGLMAADRLTLWEACELASAIEDSGITSALEQSGATHPDHESSTDSREASWCLLAVVTEAMAGEYRWRTR